MAPTDFFNRIRSYYHKETVKTPVISSWTAAALSATCVLLYVIPFYFSKNTRPSPTLSRDSPSVIRARIRAVSLACIFESLSIIILLTKYGHTTPAGTLHMLGWWPLDPLDMLRSMLLCCILFAGPLFEAAIVEGRWEDWVRGTYLVETLSSWTGWRNLVAGPVTEEIVFRSVLIPLHLLARETPERIVFITPLYFAIAHVHHLYEFRLTRPDVPLLPAVLRTVVQFTYTSLFGFFATFVFLRTGSVYTAILAHMFCNWMGLPRLWGRVGPKSASNVRNVDKGESSAPRLRAKEGFVPQTNIAWSFAYYALLGAGAYGLYVFLFPLTLSRHALVEFAKS